MQQYEEKRQQSRGMGIYEMIVVDINASRKSGGKCAKDEKGAGWYTERRRVA
jgi:hypothetical protein